jgi:hypothetical protein
VPFGLSPKHTLPLLGEVCFPIQYLFQKSLLHQSPGSWGLPVGGQKEQKGWEAKAGGMSSPL